MMALWPAVIDSIIHRVTVLFSPMDTRGPAFATSPFHSDRASRDLLHFCLCGSVPHLKHCARQGDYGKGTARRLHSRVSGRTEECVTRSRSSGNHGSHF